MGQTWVPRRVQILGRDLAKAVEDLQQSVANALQQAQIQFERKSPCEIATSKEHLAQRGATVWVPSGLTPCSVIAPFPFDGDDFFVYRQVTSGTVYVKTRPGQGTIVGSGNSYTLPTTVGAYHFRGINRQWVRVI